MKWNSTSLKKSDNSFRNIQASQVYLVKSQWQDGTRKTLVSGSLPQGHTHLCYLEDTVHGGRSLLPGLREEVSVEAGKIERDQAGHREPEKQHVAGLPGLWGRDKATGFLCGGHPHGPTAPPAQRPPRTPHTQCFTTRPLACSLAATLVGKKNSTMNKQKSLTCQCNGFLSLAPFSMQSAFQEKWKTE